MDSQRKLKALLALVGMNQADLARRFHLSEMSISRKIRGVTPWTNEEKALLAHVLAISEIVLSQILEGLDDLR